jgi:hypothetical protein
MELSERDIEQGYWYYRPEEQFPPKSIMFPYEYEGDHRLNVICTQTDLSSSRQKKLVEEWCQTFPKLKNVKILWLSSRVNQDLFEAVCEMKNLIGLNMKWGAIKRIDSIQKLKGLTQLYEWLLSDHGKSAHRLRILLILAAALGAIPLFAFSMYLWSLGRKVSNYQRFPLPGQRLIRDTPILEGQAAMTRVRVLRTLAVFLAVAGVMLCFVFLWLISILEELAK